MSLKIELDARALKMTNILDEVNTALTEKGTQGVKNFSEIPGAIDNIFPILQDKTVTENGTYTADAGYDGLGTVQVAVAGNDGIDWGVRWEAVNANDRLMKITVYGEVIPWNAFYQAQSLTDVTLPSNLKRIARNGFYGCSVLKTLALPEGFESIGEGAFNNCSSLELTRLPDSVKSIGANAFANCRKLALTSMPSSLTLIEDRAFQQCTSLTEITFNSTPEIYSTAFNNCTNLTTINVPWAEGEVANAPWGATNAVINYNYNGNTGG